MQSIGCKVAAYHHRSLIHHQFRHVPPPRDPQTVGRPRLKGARRPTLPQVAADPATVWTPLSIDGWYGGGERVVEITAQTALWYQSGKPPVPLRWVLLRDPQGADASPVVYGSGR
ncbi:MAG TPA: hypothetical protein VFE42_02940 [Chloroflexota bacterium]|nr:hypothetical protein [Chloroflexota bacterium]